MTSVSLESVGGSVICAFVAEMLLVGVFDR